jgi:hypothetical protein
MTCSSGLYSFIKCHEFHVAAFKDLNDLVVDIKYQDVIIPTVARDMDIYSNNFNN